MREQLEAKDKEIDRLKQELNNNQTELDASVIAQKALKSDLEATQSYFRDCESSFCYGWAIHQTNESK